MKHLFSTLAFTLVFTVASSAQNEVFSTAQSAYDDGRYAEAVLLYDQLADSGVANMELHYNLGNAAFKDSDLPKAVFHYRKAWHQAPRDPDIEANLRFALNAAGAIEPGPGFIERILSTLARDEWIAVAVGGYVLLMSCLGLMLFLPSARRALFRLGLVPVTILFLAGAGWWYWTGLEANPEWVVVKNDATALFGPVEGSTAHYKLPLAALVRQTDTDSKGWIEVEYDGKRGWLEADNIQRVFP